MCVSLRVTNVRAGSESGERRRSVSSSAPRWCCQSNAREGQGGFVSLSLLLLFSLE